MHINWPGDYSAAATTEAHGRTMFAQQLTLATAVGKGGWLLRGLEGDGELSFALCLLGCIRVGQIEPFKWAGSGLS